MLNKIYSKQYNSRNIYFRLDNAGDWWYHQWFVFVTSDGRLLVNEEKEPVS